jgi:hypothetical protein
MWLAIGSGIVAAGWTARWWWCDRGFTPAPATRHTHAGPALQQVRELSSLTVLTAEVTDVQVSRWQGYTGGAKAVVVLRGDVMLSTDLSRARFLSLDHVRQAAVLLLPPPQVSSARVDHERTRVACLVQYGLWRLAPDDSSQAAAAMIDHAYANAQAMVTSAGHNASLDARARLQTKQVITTFFQSLGWTVTVRWSDQTPNPL